MSNWTFDQAPNVAAFTTRQVLDDGLPILNVVHYPDDESWAFTCGTTDAADDIRVIAMSEAVTLDPTLYSIAHLPPGWCASRVAVGAPWEPSRVPSEASQ